MPKDIVIETCPAPECNLSEQDVEQFVDEMTEYIELFRPGFARGEQSEWSQVYVCGLLGKTERKNIERMALELGVKVRSLQHFMGQSLWPTKPLLTIHQEIVGSTLGEKDGVVLIDESGVIKQGDDSVGVSSQYCGSVGKVANSQNGVYLGYSICEFFSPFLALLKPFLSQFDTAVSKYDSIYGQACKGDYVLACKLFCNSPILASNCSKLTE